MLLENDDKLSSSIMETNEFALREFDHPLTMLQQKLYWMSLALIHKGENPEEPSKLYDLDINDMAKLMNTDVKSLRKNMKDAIAKFGDTSVSLRPTFKTAPKKTAYLLGIYQIIFVDQDNASKIQIGFNYYFRKKILEMKQVHDIEYPLKTIVSFRSKYAIQLYIYLIAASSVLRDEQKIINNRYEIKIDKDDLMRVLQYDGRTADFNRRALAPAIKSINEYSEIYIENGMPEYITNGPGKRIVGYIFRIRITTSIGSPIFSKPLLIPGKNADIPGWDYLEQTMKGIGCAQSFISNVKLHDDRKRLWGNLLYTWYLAGNSARYLNKAYKEDYFKSIGMDIGKLVSLLLEEKPGYRDDFLTFVETEYAKKKGHKPTSEEVHDMLQKFYDKNGIVAPKND